MLQKMLKVSGNILEVSIMDTFCLLGVPNFTLDTFVIFNLIFDFILFKTFMNFSTISMKELEIITNKYMFLK